VTNGQIANIKVYKPIAWGMSVSGTNVQVTNHFHDAAPINGTRDQAISFPSNTDGIGIGGTNITVDGYYGYNGDDCINITNGGSNIVAKNGYCGFASHGLSIGSLGQDGSTASVSNVLFQNWTMEGAVYAARVRYLLQPTYLLC
jgi:polygalacturonase